jgi:hypothetical protein
MDEDTYALSEAGIDTIIRIDEMFRTTDYDHERIAWEVGLPTAEAVQILYALGNLSGVIDAIQEFQND